MGAVGVVGVVGVVGTGLIITATAAEIHPFRATLRL
jgi:uncharacterized protein YlxW (UPF0749 family)